MKKKVLKKILTIIFIFVFPLFFTSCVGSENPVGFLIIHNEIGSGGTITRINIVEILGPSAYQYHYNDVVSILPGDISKQYSIEIINYDSEFIITITIDSQNKSTTINLKENIVTNLYFDGEIFIEG